MHGLIRPHSRSLYIKTDQFGKAAENNSPNYFVKLLNHFELNLNPTLSIADLKLEEDREKRLRASVSSLSSIQSQLWPLMLKNIDMVLITALLEDKVSTYFMPPYLRMDTNSPSLDLLVLTDSLETTRKHLKTARSLNKLRHLQINGLLYKDSLIEACAKFKESKVLFAHTVKFNELIDANLIERGSIGTVVVDNVDLQQDMGVEDALLNVFAKLQVKQRVLISSTWQRHVQNLTERITASAVQVKLSINLANAPIKHSAVFHPERLRNERLESSLKYFLKLCNDRALVYTSSDRVSENVQRYLEGKGISAEVVSDSMDLHEVHQIQQRLRDNSLQVVVSTVIASRFLSAGLFSLAVNFSCPLSLDDYKDRLYKFDMTRFNRMFTLLSYSDSIFSPLFIKVFEESGQPMPNELLTVENSLEDMDPGTDDAECVSRFERQNNEAIYFDL
jgi:ATP-dependent RNA helicase DDX5/DBP2